MEAVIPKTLEDAKIEGLPDTAYYLPNFITEDEEQRLLERIIPRRDWTELSKRRLQTYPSALVNNKLVDAPLPSWLKQPVVSRLLSIPISEKLEAAEATSSHTVEHLFSGSPHKEPNHCLVNQYEPGQGIMPHEDGGAYHPVVATISLAAPIVLDIYEKHPEGGIDSRPNYRILQEPRSLLITTRSLYTDYLHGIAKDEQDRDLGRDTIANWDLLISPNIFEAGQYQRQTRTSLTYRDVRAVVKASKLIPGLQLGKR